MSASQGEDDSLTQIYVSQLWYSKLQQTVDHSLLYSLRLLLVKMIYFLKWRAGREATDP